jgi:predicted AlkP superfamily pyrophosphatase or phosphodiesterase
MLGIMLICFSNATAQQKVVTRAKSPLAKPKLVVGLVIDQMRWDYLYRYQARYGNGGFKRLIGEGYSYENTQIPYIPTYTAVGHTCVYTGSIPAISGIVGNNWFEKSINRNVYCTEDSLAAGVGNNDYQGKMSPNNLWSTTITDELRLSNNFQSKVIAISLKDRGAILPAGHTANGAYWYDEKTGKWISSTFYMKSLPGWVTKFNEKDPAGELMKKDWETLYPINTYTLSTIDSEPYESVIPGETTSTFPHKISTITAGKYFAFKYTPSAATFTFDFAKEAIANERLGSNTVTDFLAVSVSSTDYMGHSFGPNSIEAEDTYLRLDKDIADFLTYLDNKLGKDNYLVFLTADHGVAHIPGFMNEHGMGAGIFSDLTLQAEINKAVSDHFGIANAVLSLQNYQVYLDLDAIRKQDKDLAGIKDMIIRRLKSKPYIINAFELKDLSVTTLPEPIKTMISNGYNGIRSGDIQFVSKPGYFDGSNRGTTHGLWNPYDSHIPLLFFGWNVPHGKSNRTIYMTDIAPTIAAKLQIQMPSGNVGTVLGEVVN